MMKKNLLSAALLSVCMLMGCADARYQNATLKTVFTDEFFKNSQKNFVPKICEHIQEQLTDIHIWKDHELWIPNLFAFVFTLEHLDVRSMCVSVIDSRIVTLSENGQVRLDLQKLIVDLSASYKLGTYPSLNIEESGAVYLFSYASLMLETSIRVDDKGGLWAERTTGFGFSGSHVDLRFTGSYVSQAFASIITHLLNTVLDILQTQAFLLNQHERGLVVIHDSLNFILAEVPTRFNLTETDELFLVGGLHSTPKVVANDSLSMEFNYHVQTIENNVKQQNLAVFKDTPRRNDSMHFYQMEISVSEYFLQSALTSLYGQGLLVSEPAVLDESSMGSFRSALNFNWGLSKEFTTSGFNTKTMFCRVVPFAANEPVVTISKETYFALNTTIMVDFSCSTNENKLNVKDVTKLNGTEKNITYAHAFTLLMKPAYISTKLNATNASLEIAMQNVTLDLQFDHVTKSSIGPIDGGVNSFIHSYVQPFIKPAVQFEMETRHIPTGELIVNATGLAWLDFHQSHIEFEDHYFTLYTTPIFEHPHLRNKFNEDVGPRLFNLPMLDTPEEKRITTNDEELSLDEQIEIYLAESQQQIDETGQDVFMI